MKIDFFFSFIAKASEFIFLELNSSVSQKEELKLKDIMMEISKTNGESELSYPLSWVQAFPLFQDIPSKESSFVHYYCASTCSFPVAADTELRRKSLSQVSMRPTQLTEGREVEIGLLFKMLFC